MDVSERDGVRKDYAPRAGESSHVGFKFLRCEDAKGRACIDQIGRHLAPTEDIEGITFDEAEI